MTVFDVARSINALTKQRATKANDETPIPIEDIEEVLSNYVSSNDPHSISENHDEHPPRTSRRRYWVTVIKMSEFVFFL